MCSLGYLRDIGIVDGASTDALPASHAVNATPMLREGGVTEARALAADGIQPTLRVLTFNVLFPNSEASGVWHIYKYFDAADADVAISTGRVDATAWPHRAASLQRLVGRIDADIVCFQEPWNSRGADSFNSDLAFMRDLGYEGELLEKGSIRPATFWKVNLVETAPHHGEAPTWKGRSNDQKPKVLRKISANHKVNRALLSLFEVSVDAHDINAASAVNVMRPLVAVVNCHLTADPRPEGMRDRLKCMQDALKKVKALYDDATKTSASAVAKPKKGKDAVGAAVVAKAPLSILICGDFNSTGGLLDSFLTTGASDDGSKQAKHEFPHFVDCGKESGPTLIVPDIDTKMSRPLDQRHPLPEDLAVQAEQNDQALRSAPGRLDESGALETNLILDPEVLRAVNEQVLPSEMLSKLRQCFDNIRKSPAGLQDGERLGEDEISAKQVNWWLLQVNRAVGRGTEFRRAREMQLTKLLQLSHAQIEAAKQNDELLPPLTFHEFATASRLEIAEGKYWAQEHDAQKLCGSGMRKRGEPSYQARFDHIYMSSAAAGGLRAVSADVVALFPEEVGGVDGELRSLADLGFTTDRKCAFVLPNVWHPSDHLPVVADFLV